MNLVFIRDSVQLQRFAEDVLIAKEGESLQFGSGCCALRYVRCAMQLLGPASPGDPSVAALPLDDEMGGYQKALDRLYEVPMPLTTAAPANASP